MLKPVHSLPCSAAVPTDLRVGEEDQGHRDRTKNTLHPVLHLSSELDSEEGSEKEKAA